MSLDQWVWLDCDKHGYHQLRDLVVVQPGYVCEQEYIKCGCRYKANDPELELSRLRAYEAQQVAEMTARWAAALNPKPSPLIGFKWAWWMTWLVAIGAALFLWRLTL